jgi:hypothetical protein
MGLEILAENLGTGIADQPPVKPTAVEHAVVVERLDLTANSNA